MNWLDRKINDFICRVRDNPKIMKVAVGPADDPTYHRWFVIPRNPFFNIYLHRFRHSDAEDLHDHRMANISIILQGSYCEQRFVRKPVVGKPLPDTRIIPVFRLRPFFRRAATPHRVVLTGDIVGMPSPVWSLFIGFPHVRNWGFWMVYHGIACWIPHQAYVSDTDPLSAGYGQNRSAAE